jgi:hypothetical protein
MNYHINLNSSIFFAVMAQILSIFSLMGMDPQDRLILIDPKKDIHERLEIAKWYIDHKGGVNNNIRCNWTMPTGYLDAMPVDDIKYPNLIIDYFFERGANFSNNGYHKKIFDYILLRNNPHRVENSEISKEILLDRIVDVAMLCLDAKLKHSEMYKKVLDPVKACWVFKCINERRCTNIKNITIPKCVYRNIINTYIGQELAQEEVIQEEAIRDIVTPLNVAEEYCSSLYLSDKPHVPLDWLKLIFEELVTDEQSYKQKGLEIFNPEAWEKNPIRLINTIAKRVKEKK